MQVSWTRRAITAGATAVLALGACAGDDDAANGNTTTSEATSIADGSDADVAAFCDAIDDMGLGVSLGEGYEGVDEALVAAEEIAPEEIETAVTTMADESRAQLAAGPPSGGTPDPPPGEFFTAAAEVGDYMAESCGYQVVDVTATDDGFDGVPADVPAGKTLLQLTNDGTKSHQVVLQRIKDSETRSVEEIAALPDDEEGDLLDFVGGAAAGPGGGSWTVVDLSEGRHAALCFAPSDDASQTEGTVAELQVT